jgi:hypothetical protein
MLLQRPSRRRPWSRLLSFAHSAKFVALESFGGFYSFGEYLIKGKGSVR